MASEVELAGVLLQQLLETLQRDNLPERRVHSLRPGLCAKNPRGFISELGVEPD